MMTNKPRHGYERKRPQLPTKTLGRPVAAVIAWRY